MKRVYLFLLSALLVLNSVVVFADTTYDEFVTTVLENTDIDMSVIDKDNIFVAEITNHIMLGKELEATRFYLMMPSKETDDFFTSYFEKDVYVLTEKNFTATEPLKYLDKEIAKSYISKNGLSEPSEIKALVIHERMHMYAYSVVCNDETYIIPYYFTDESIFNITDDAECELEIGKAYSVNEFVDICEKEQTLYDEYRAKKQEEEKNQTPSMSMDENGNVVENEGKEQEKDTDTQNNKEENETSPDDKSTDDAETNESSESSATEENKDADTEIMNVSFIDVPATHWGYAEITDLAKKNVVLGYGNGYFGVNDAVTHEHLALLLERLFDYNENDTRSIAAIREDIIVSLVKAMNADLSDVDVSVINKQFADGDTISEENEKYIAYAIKSKLVVGYNGKLSPDSNVTRAETAVLLYRAMELVK